MGVSVTINDNLAEVLDQFETAKSKALLQIGTTIQAEAAMNSPVRTGALRGSWVAQVNEDESSVTVGVPMDALKGNYAKYVELGTSKMQAKHMLGNALNARINEFPDVIISEMKNV